MKPLQRWLVAIATDSAMGLCAYLWLGRGVEGAGSVFLFALAFVGAIGTLASAVCLLAPLTRDLSPFAGRSLSYRTYQWLAALIWTFILAWTEHYVIACLYSLATLLVAELYRQAALDTGATA